MAIHVTAKAAYRIKEGLKSQGVQRGGPASGSEGEVARGLSYVMRFEADEETEG